MAALECRVTVRMPVDQAGVSPEPGDLVVIDDADETMQRWMQWGYLVPTLQQPMPEALIPEDARAAKRKGKATDGADA